MARRRSAVLGAAGLFAAALFSLICGRPAVAQEAQLAMLEQLAGRWSGFGNLRTGPSAAPQRVDCTLDIRWATSGGAETSGRMQQTLACTGRGARFALSGELALQSNHPVLSGILSASDQAGGSFAHCEFRGRALYITMVNQTRGGGDRQFMGPVDTSHWVLLLNRGDRRLGSVMRRHDRAGRSYEALSLSLVKQIGHRRSRPVMAEPVAPSAPPPSAMNGFTEPPVER